ncbi:MAG: ABC transporter permease [Clostridiaceae bacterium]|nr:ABC transporter permease [Clostridiaceae bacterium]
MRSYLAFTQKEFCEAARTYKLLIMAAVFALFGMMNPITAKITPQMLDALMPPEMKITLGEPTAMDSWAQFFKNVPQMGLIVLVIVFSGIMANEFSRGTLINVLTKGLARSTVILAKFTMSASLWTVSYVLCFGLTYIYTAYFWKNAAPPNLLFSVFCLWLFGVLLLASVILGGVLFKSNYACLLFTGGFVVVLFLINIIPQVQKYNPVGLAENNMPLLKNAMSADFAWPVALCCVMIIGFVGAAVALFNKKQL